MQNILLIYEEWNSQQRYFDSPEEFADSLNSFFHRRMQYYGIPFIEDTLTFTDYELDYTRRIINAINNGGKNRKLCPIGTY